MEDGPVDDSSDGVGEGVGDGDGEGIGLGDGLARSLISAAAGSGARGGPLTPQADTTASARVAKQTKIGIKTDRDIVCTP